MTNLANLRTHFKGLDEDFINRDKINDDVYAYDSSDVLVQTTFELPIIIECAGSTVHYEFTSNQGDISFGVEFQSEKGEDFGVEEPRRVNFAEQPLRGTFDVKQRGVVFFLWDNCYDWSGEKRISYVVRIEQPAFSQADKRRSSRSIAMLSRVTPILDGLHEKYRSAAESFSYNQSYLYVLNSRMNVLQQNLADRMYERSEMDAAAAMAEETIFGNEVLTTLFGIRCLDSDTLVHLLQYMDPFVAGMVCKHWKALVEYIHSPLYGRISFSDALQQTRNELELEDMNDNESEQGGKEQDKKKDGKGEGDGTERAVGIKQLIATGVKSRAKVPRKEVDAILEKLKANVSQHRFYEDDLNRIEKEITDGPALINGTRSSSTENNSHATAPADDTMNIGGELDDSSSAALVSAGATAAVEVGYIPREAEDGIDPECAAFEATGKFDELMTARVDEFLTFLCVPMLQLLPREYMDNLVDELSEILDNYVLEYMADKYVKNEDELDAYLVDYLQRREVMWVMEDHRDDIVDYFASDSFQQQLKDMNEKQRTADISQNRQEQEDELRQGLLSDKSIAMLVQYGKQAKARSKKHRDEQRKAKHHQTKGKRTFAAKGEGIAALPTVEEEEEEEEEDDEAGSVDTSTTSSAFKDGVNKAAGGAQRA